MKEFSYTITDSVGIHARPAGVLVKLIKPFASKCTITKGDKTEELGKLMKVMGMGIKCGDTVVIKVEGSDEAAAAETIDNFFKENL